MRKRLLGIGGGRWNLVFHVVGDRGMRPETEPSTEGADR
jgi:hypothetical protein